MANNAIEVFPEEIAMNGDQRNFNLQKLDISGNPLSCDCHLDWAEKISKIKISFILKVFGPIDFFQSLIRLGQKCA